MEETKITFEDIQKANEQIKTIKISRKDKKTNKVITKNYAEVAQRIKAFRMVYPSGAIIPEMISNENGICMFKATIMDNDGNVIAIGHAQENSKSSIINQTNFIENCETSAVGRGLGLAGFGVDVSLSSAEDIKSSMVEQDIIENTPMNDKQLEIISGLEIPLKEQLRNFYEKDPTQMTYSEAETAIESLKKRGLIKTREEQEFESKKKVEVF